MIYYRCQGMNIVHPPYDTDAEHFARIPVDDVTIPECDLLLIVY